MIRKKKFQKNGRIGTVVIYVIILFAALITLCPFLYVIANSLSNPINVIRRDVVLWPVNFSLQSYTTLFQQNDILQAYGNTILYTLVGTIVNIVLTVMAAYALSVKRFFLRKQISLFIVITMFVSGGIIPSYIVVNKVGLYDSFWALIIPTAISAYNLIVARSFFESIPEELSESAHMDGANDFTILWKIIVPISKPIISVLIIFYAVGHWNEYFNPMIYLKSRELKPIQLYLRDIMVANQQASTSTGGTGAERQYYFEALKFSTIVVTTLPITVIYPFFQKYFVQGMMVGAVKS